MSEHSQSQGLDISIIVPLLNEAESIPELSAWIQRVLVAHGLSYELLFIDDGSTDESWRVIEQLREQNSAVKGIKFRRNYGKSAALHTGFQEVVGKVVITMDADLQDSPDELPELYRMIEEDGYDLVSGWKRKRYDPVFSKNIPSKIFNWFACKASGIKLHDFNCGLKAYRLQVVRSIEVYGDMHRYIPVIAKWAGFKKIGEKVVIHQERKYGTTKFGMERFIRGPLDLLSVIFIAKFSKRPMHFFGVLGFVFFFLGVLSASWMGIDKLLVIHRGLRAPLVTDSPFFYIALVGMIIGCQLFMTGFIAELVSRQSSARNKYLIDEKLI
ncbi:MAG: glycosyltransferase family 2 protein [Mangrovibacterium sp.]